MKKVILSLVFASLSFYAFAQVPNPSFENWTNGEADSWQSDNFSSYIMVTQSNQPHAGNSAVKIGVANAGGNNTPGVISTSYGTGITQEGDSLTGWYKSNLVNGDQFVVSLAMYSAGSMVATSIIYFPATQSTYTRFAVGAMQFIVAPIDSVTITITVDNISTPPDLNSYAIVDELHLGSTASSIQEQQQAENLAVFPNPSSSVINFTNPEEAILEIYSSEGKLVMSKPLAKGDAELDLSGMPEGMLMMVLRNNNQTTHCKIYHTL